MSTSTNVDDFISELNGGVFKEKLAAILSKAAQGTVTYGNGKRKAKVNIELTVSQLGENEQVVVSHKLMHKTPTKRGFVSEEDTTETSMFVGRGGAMTISQPKEGMTGQFRLEGEQDGMVN